MSSGSRSPCATLAQCLQTIEGVDISFQIRGILCFLFFFSQRKLFFVRLHKKNSFHFSSQCECFSSFARLTSCLHQSLKEKKKS